MGPRGKIQPSFTPPKKKLFFLLSTPKTVEKSKKILQNSFQSDNPTLQLVVADRGQLPPPFLDPPQGHWKVAGDGRVVTLSSSSQKAASFAVHDGFIFWLFRVEGESEFRQ
ncbi:hypothetical protein TNCV_2206341 [Trichonephila clavipes]|uniref:Uncharacterized protein n=1 Tax=Trichonephila clavipes TaxID=2585209 RepID=A0A8X6S5K5_TRICX|nr:hypothetical protein TNCV_2206341 [Trichonephila clavipes]